MKFIIASDIHYIAKDLIKGSKLFDTIYHKSDGKEMNYIEEIVDAFIEQVISIHPDGGLILSGDLTYNGERKSHLQMAKKLMQVYQAGIPVYVIPGNHDVNNFRAYRYLEESMAPVERVSPNTFTKIYSHFGYENALFKDPHSLSYVVCLNDKIWIFMLDTCIYENNSLEEPTVSGGHIRRETLQWLEDCLYYAQIRGAFPLIVGHHNLIHHNDVYQKNFTMDNHQELLMLLSRYKAPLYFSGHMHTQHIASLKMGSHRIFDVASSALPVYQNQFGIIDFVPNRMLSYTTCRLDMESWAAKHQPNNPDLMNFCQYSQKFFEDLTYNKEYSKLIEQQYSPEEADKMAQVVVKLNSAYFSGKVGTVQDEIIESEGLQLWTHKGSGQMQRYIFSMLKPVLRDDTCLLLFFPNLDFM